MDAKNEKVRFFAATCPQLFEIHETWRDGNMCAFLTKQGEGIAGDELDPFTDLNVMHAVEAVMSHEEYISYGRHIEAVLQEADCYSHPNYFVSHANAGQRAEAYLRTKAAMQPQPARKD